MKSWPRNALLICCTVVAAGGIAIAQNPAIVPAPRTEMVWESRGETWMGRFYANVRQVEAGDVDLLFIGDSITHSWDTLGAEVWEKYYGHRRAVNLGFGGDRTQHVLWRLIHGKLDRARPSVAVLMIGTNNANTETPDQIAGGVRAICNTLRGLLPETKILVLGVFPRGKTADDWRRAINNAANAMIAELDDGEWVHYLDIGDRFLEPGGVLPESIMPDGLHPNERGYQIWAEAMEPALARLIGDRPITARRYSARPAAPEWAREERPRR